MNLGRVYRAATEGLRSTWVKAGLSLLIVYGLFHYNRVDAQAFSVLVPNWRWLGCALLCTLPSYLVVALRFHQVLANQGIIVPFARALRWTMVGSLLDIVMPSSSGGDLVKAGMVVNHVGAGRRTQGVAAVAFDRVLGMLGLFLLAGLAGVVALPSVLLLPHGERLLTVLVAAPLGLLLFFRIVGARRIYGHPRLKEWQGKSWWRTKSYALIGCFNALREQPKTMVVVLALSMANHIFWCASLFFITMAFGHDVGLLMGYALFPLAIFGNVFGFAGGFGLGTVGFDLVFQQFFAIADGAAIGLTFQSLSGLSRLTGLPFYLATPGRARRPTELPGGGS